MPHGIILGKCEEMEQSITTLKANAEQAHTVFHELEERQNNNEILTTEELAKKEAIETALSACETCLTAMCSELTAQIESIDAVVRS